MRPQISATELPNVSKLIPVLVIDDVNDAVPLAKALVAGGVPTLEVTLRTPAAIGAIKAIIEAVPDAIVGAGTVMNVGDLRQCLEIGCQFIVSPGSTNELLSAARSAEATILPGVATVSEAMRAAAYGCEILKFFPASINGGPAALKAIGGPLINTKFCPTGGVSEENMNDYLSLDNVVCVGGSWMAPKAMIKAGDWAGIEAITKRSVEAAV